MPKLPAAQVTPPRQKRSHDTLEALLRATAHLLETRSFKDVTINSILREAGSSAGSFYARFADKNALLHALHERFCERAREQARHLAGGIHPASLRFDELTRLLMEELIRTHSSNRGVLRAALMEALVDPGFVHRVRQVTRDVAKAVTPLLNAAEPTHHISAANVETGLQTVLAVLDQDLFLGLGTPRGTAAPRAMREPEWLNRIFLTAIEA